MRIAAGEKLPPQEALAISGHAVEARLYAEDPAKGFLPSIGTLRRLALPGAGEGVRVDTGVRQGDAVTMFYDPMIAKVIAHGATRAEARQKLARAMEDGFVKEPAVVTQRNFDAKAHTPEEVEKARAVLTALQWAQTWFETAEGAAVELTHTTCGGPFGAVMTCDQCTRPLRGAEIATV